MADKKVQIQLIARDVDPPPKVKQTRAKRGKMYVEWSEIPIRGKVRVPLSIRRCKELWKEYRERRPAFEGVVLRFTSVTPKVTDVYRCEGIRTVALKRKEEPPREDLRGLINPDTGDLL